MLLKFTVEVEVERIQGKFASKDDIESELNQALYDANPSSISGLGADGTSEYEVTNWEVEPA